MHTEKQAAVSIIVALTAQDLKLSLKSVKLCLKPKCSKTKDITRVGYLQLTSKYFSPMRIRLRILHMCTYINKHLPTKKLMYKDQQND